MDAKLRPIIESAVLAGLRRGFGAARLHASCMFMSLEWERTRSACTGNPVKAREAGAAARRFFSAEVVPLLRREWMARKKQVSPARA